MPRIEIYTKRWCGYCHMARALLTHAGLTFEEYDLSANPGLEAEMRRRSGRATVPQVFIDGRPIGGYTDLCTLQAAGELPRTES